MAVKIAPFERVTAPYAKGYGKSRLSFNWNDFDKTMLKVVFEIRFHNEKAEHVYNNIAF